MFGALYTVTSRKLSVPQTLEAFIKEAGLDTDAATTSPGDWTLEKVLEEKQQYDTSLKYEKRSNEGDQGWTLPGVLFRYLPTFVEP